MSTAADIIEKARKAFADVPRPEHFTDHMHCCECADHDAELAPYTPDTLPYQVVGNPGWDPICFVTPQAFLYLFPGLIRLALEGEGDEYYIDQFLFHVTYDGRKSRFFQHFSREQRKVTLEALWFMVDHKIDAIEAPYVEPDLEIAIALWEELVYDAE